MTTEDREAFELGLGAAAPLVRQVYSHLDVTKVSPLVLGRQLWCFKSVTLNVSQAVVVLQKCHPRCQTGSGVTKVSHSVSGRQ
jgi:hypothetical protein